MTPRGLRMLLAGIACCLGLAARALAADVVLLASTAPGYAPGMAIALTDRLALPDGASATLLFRSGEMLKLRGPFDGTLEHLSRTGQALSVSGLAEVFRLQGVDASVIGGTRTLGGGRQRMALDDVQVDPQRSGNYCIASATSVWLGRPAADDGVYGLRRYGNVRQLAWPADVPRIAWPDDVPIEDGDRVELLHDGVPRVTFGFRVMPEKPASTAAWIAAGILNGCDEQFAAPLRQLRRGALAPELWLTTDRGRSPLYHPGERVALTAQSDADGYLYCVLARDDQSAVPVFPAGALDGAHVRAAEPLTIPGNRHAPDLHVGAPGTEQVRCWFADHDISPELPHALFDAAAPRLGGDLGAVFGALGGGISQTTLTLRIQ